MSPASMSPASVFISYAHKDNESSDPSTRWLDRLLEYLKPLDFQKQVHIWSDKDIEIGTDWQSSIQISLAQARAAVLLISPAFLASQYIRNSELPVLLKNAKDKGLIIIPIILRSSLLKETQFKYPDPYSGPQEISLASLQSANSPTRPLNSLQEHEQDKVLLSVAQRLLRIVQAPMPTSGKSEKYRPGAILDGNPEFPTGYFSRTDTIHVHVDGGTENDLVMRIFKELDQKEMPSKLNAIHETIAGRQRLQFPDIYQVHTPGAEAQEELEYFSTTLLSSKSASDTYNSIDKKLKPLLAELSNTTGIVIEVERVIGKIGEGIEWTEKLLSSYPPISPNRVGFNPKEVALPVEIHYAIDINKEEDWQQIQPFSLQELLDKCAELQISVGGWFRFDKDEDEAWAYRSNSFETEFITGAKIKEQRDRLAQWLANLSTERNFKYKINVLVEQILGIWKTPLERTYSFKTLKELAAWERYYLNLKKFWVVAPNFLGDKNQEVTDAMISNLAKGVEYTYFLHSFADFRRLRKFTKSLERRLRDTLAPQINISEQIKAVLFELSTNSRNEYFIANPHLEEPHGYKLIRYPDTGEVSEGIELESHEVKSIVNLLQPLTENLQVKQWSRISIQPDEDQKYHILICTDLENCTEGGESLPPYQWEEILEEYDLIVAEEVSKCGGVVAKNISNGYLIIFENSNSAWGSAVSCAKRLQKAVQEYNKEYNNTKVSSGSCLSLSQKIALHWGLVSRVIRAYGNDLIGEDLNRCKELLRQTEFKKIYITEQFHQRYEQSRQRDMENVSDNSVIENIIPIPNKPYYELNW